MGLTPGIEFWRRPTDSFVPAHLVAAAAFRRVVFEQATSRTENPAPFHMLGSQFWRRPIDSFAPAQSPAASRA
jgi:hypothetical protein